MRAKPAVAAACALATGLWGGVALASPSDTYGATPRGVATAGALTAGADDGSSAYYNPAGLGLGAAGGKASVSVGYLAGVPLMGINRELGDAAHLAAQPTSLPPSQGFAAVSALFPLGGKLANKAALGLLMYHPQDKLVRVQLIDPHQPQWTRFSSSPDRLELAVGLGVRFGDKVAVGVGANVLAGLSGTVDFQIDLLAKRVDRRNLDFALKTTAAPIAGFTVTPTDKLRLSFAYRGALSLALSQPNIINLGDIGTLVLDVSGVVHYTPHELAAGVSFEPTESLRVMVDAKFAMWSLAPYPAAQVQVKLQGQVPEALGLDKALSFGTKDPSPGFKNTLTPSVAVEYTFPDKVTRLRGGYAFRPTYVPDQVLSRSNFLDNSAHVLGLGATFQFHDPSEVFTQPLKIDLAAQGQLMQRRDVKKDQRTSDPVGNYDFGGAAIAASASIRYEF